MRRSIVRSSASSGAKTNFCACSKERKSRSTPTPRKTTSAPSSPSAKSPAEPSAKRAAKPATPARPRQDLQETQNPLLRLSRRPSRHPWPRHPQPRDPRQPRPKLTNRPRNLPTTLQGPARIRWRRRSFARVACRFFGLSFRAPPVFFEQVKGWRRFLIADARAPVPSDPGGRGASSRKGKTLASNQRAKGPRTQGWRTGRSIRCPAKITSALKRARSGFELGTCGRAPALHACDCLTNPCLSILSLLFRR